MISGGEEGDHLPPIKLNINQNYIAGVDEVGRGCVFGPVFAGAIILDRIHQIKLLNNGLKDSKQ